MARARIVTLDPVNLPCSNCGAVGEVGIQVVTEKDHVAVQCCERCWPAAIRKGQLGVVAEMCRMADGLTRPVAPEELLR